MSPSIVSIHDQMRTQDLNLYAVVWSEACPGFFSSEADLIFYGFREAYIFASGAETYLFFQISSGAYSPSALWLDNRHASSWNFFY